MVVDTQLKGVDIMAAEYSANAAQTVSANGTILFTEAPNPCREGLIYHKDGSGIFRVVNKFFRQNIMNCWRRNTNYSVAFQANIAVPTGGTVEPISIGIATDGEIDPSSIAIFTPAEVEEFGSVNSIVVVTVPFVCGCSNVSVRNLSTQPITVQNANIIFNQGG